MSETNQPPKYARLFAERIEQDGMNRTDAIIDTVEHLGQTEPAVFIRLLPGLDFGAARLRAERATVSATWAFARAAENGVILDTRHFAKFPEYLLSEDFDGVVVQPWINALAAKESAATYERVKTAANAAAEEYRKAISAGTWPTIQYKLVNQPRRPTYAVNELFREDNGPVRQLLNRLGIK